MSNPNNNEQVHKPVVKEQWLTDENQGLLSNMTNEQIHKFIRYVGYTRWVNSREYNGTKYRLVCVPINVWGDKHIDDLAAPHHLECTVWYWIWQITANKEIEFLKWAKYCMEQDLPAPTETGTTLVSMFVKTEFSTTRVHTSMRVIGAVKENLSAERQIDTPILKDCRDAAHWILMNMFQSRMHVWPRLANHQAAIYDDLARIEIAKSTIGVLEKMKLNHIVAE